MANTTNFGWETPDDTDLVKDGAAAMRTLGNSIDASFVDLKGGTSGQILSKNSNTDLDFVWIANDQGDITAVTAGTGLTGGGTTGAVTLTNDMATTITAAGDIVVGTGSGTYDNLPIGTTGQVLTADTTVSPYKVKWASAGASFVGVSCTKSGNQSISHGVQTVATFDTEQFDTDGFHSTSTNTGRITIPSGKAGKYLFVARIWFAGSATGWRAGHFAKNGSEFAETYTTPNSNSTAWVNTVIADMAENDYMELFVNIDNGGSSLNLVGGGTRYTSFSAYLIGA